MALKQEISLSLKSICKEYFIFKVSTCSLGALMSCCLALLNSLRDFCMVLTLLLKLGGLARVQQWYKVFMSKLFYPHIIIYKNSLDSFLYRCIGE